MGKKGKNGIALSKYDFKLDDGKQYTLFYEKVDQNYNLSDGYFLYAVNYIKSGGKKLQLTDGKNPLGYPPQCIGIHLSINNESGQKKGTKYHPHVSFERANWNSHVFFTNSTGPSNGSGKAKSITGLRLKWYNVLVELAKTNSTKKIYV